MPNLNQRRTLIDALEKGGAASAEIQAIITARLPMPQKAKNTYCSAKRRMARRNFIGFALRSHGASLLKKDSLLSRSRPIGPMRIGSTATFAALQAIRKQMKRYQTLNAFLSGMWRNTEVLAFFVTWLRSYNQNTHQFADQIKPGGEPVDFYGLDLYSMTTSMSAVLAYLERILISGGHGSPRALWLFWPVHHESPGLRICNCIRKMGFLRAGSVYSAYAIATQGWALP